MFHRRIARRTALVAATVVAGLITQGVAAHAAVTQFVTTSGIQNCGPTEVTQSGNQAVTTWGPCAITTQSNVSPLYPQPDPGVFVMQASNSSSSGFPCSTGTATFSSPVTYEYRSALGTITWTGAISYSDNGQGACQSNYASTTTPLAASGSGFYVNVQELCQFFALGPDSPALTLGGPGEIAFYVDSNAPGTGCTRSN